MSGFTAAIIQIGCVTKINNFNNTAGISSIIFELLT